MAVLPDLFAENSDADNEHLPANSVRYKLLIFMILYIKRKNSHVVQLKKCYTLFLIDC